MRNPNPSCQRTLPLTYSHTFNPLTKSFSFNATIVCTHTKNYKRTPTAPNRSSNDFLRKFIFLRPRKTLYFLRTFDEPHRVPINFVPLVNFSVTSKIYLLQHRYRYLFIIDILQIYHAKHPIAILGARGGTFSAW